MLTTVYYYPFYCPHDKNEVELGEPNAVSSRPEGVT